MVLKFYSKSSQCTVLRNHCFSTKSTYLVQIGKSLDFLSIFQMLIVHGLHFISCLNNLNLFLKRIHQNIKMVIEIYCPFPAFRLCCLKDYSTNPSLQGLNAKLNTSTYLFKLPRLSFHPFPCVLCPKACSHS